MERKKILFCGYFGYGNLGDEAVLAAEIATFKKHFPELEPVVVSGNVEYTERLHKVRAVYRYGRDFLKELKEAFCLILGGGSLLQDVTSLRSVPYYLGVARLALFFGVPVFFYGQGIGPLQNIISRFLVKKIAQKVQGITVRDRESLQLLSELEVKKPPVMLAADPVFALETFTEEEKLLAGSGNFAESDVTVGVAPRLWKESNYLTDLASELEILRREKGFRIILLPFQKPADEEACKILLEKGLEAEVLVSDLTPYNILPVLSSLDLLVGVRLHALIFGALAGIPLLGISYDPKIDAFLQELDLVPVTTADSFDGQVFNSIFREVLASRLEQSRKIKERVKILKQREQVNVKPVLDYFSRFELK